MVTINLGRSGWREITDEAELHEWMETGGGPYRPRGYGFQSVVTVDAASDCGYDRKFDSASLDVLALEALEHSRRDREHDTLVAGSWHTEPGEHTEPSPHDLSLWRLLLDRGHVRQGTIRHVHLILNASHDRGWLRPNVAAYVLGREESESGRVSWVCAPATASVPR